jgi:hypothetical protein
MKKYEYKVIKNKQEGFWNPENMGKHLIEELNALDSQGWEMV